MKITVHFHSDDFGENDDFLRISEDIRGVTQKRRGTKPLKIEVELEFTEQFGFDSSKIRIGELKETVDF